MRFGSSKLNILCPLCKEEYLTFIFNIHDVPYFGEVMESTLYCEKCKFRDTDVSILEEKEGRRYIIKVENEEDLFIKVAKSKEGVIKIPEIGLEVYSTIYSQGFITNIEGILERIRSALIEIKALEGINKEKLDKILEELNKMLEGKKEFTLIIEDKTGNSAIFSDKAKVEKL